MSYLAPYGERSKVQIFGREPAFWVGFIEALLAIVLSWNMLGLTSDMIGGIMAVVVALSGVYVAYVTRDTMLGVLVGLAKSVIICLAAFQVNLTEAQTTSVIALVSLLGSAFNRSQTAPAIRPSFADPTLPAEEVPVPVDPVPVAGGHAAPVGDPARYDTRDQRGAGEARFIILVAVGVIVGFIIWTLLTRL